MHPIRTQHLVLGGNLLGLATADHLLRRGAESVLVIESGSAPSRLGLDDQGLVLRTAQPGYETLERRALLLLEEWSSYLEVDPGYRRCGSVVVPRPEPPVAGQEDLEPDGVKGRQPLLELPADTRAAFLREDGFLDTTQLLSALHWQVRRRGGRVLFDCDLEEIQDRGSDFRFRGGNRTGEAEFVYFTGDPRLRHLLSSSGLRFPVPTATWHRFQLELDSPGAALIRLALPVENEPAVGLPLELEDEPADRESAWRQAILLDAGSGEQFLTLEGGPATSEEQPPVDWGVLESVRSTLQQELPALGRSTVRRGHAENRLALDPVAPGIQRSDDGRVRAAGAFGVFTLLLSLAVAERMAEETVGAT